MSYQYHGTTDLIALPGRSMQTFPSGMIRVDRSYLCRKGLEANFREQFAVGKDLPLDDSTPAIDGLKIYPEVQEIYRDDGFVEFRASAYGRKNLDGKVEYRYRRVTAQAIASLTTTRERYDGLDENGNPVYTRDTNFSIQSAAIPDAIIVGDAIVHQCIPSTEAPTFDDTGLVSARYEETGEQLSSKTYSRAELFPSLENSRTIVYSGGGIRIGTETGRSPIVSGRVSSREAKTFGSFQEIRTIYAAEILPLDVGNYFDESILLRRLADGSIFSATTTASTETTFGSIEFRFKVPENSDDYFLRVAPDVPIERYMYITDSRNLNNNLLLSTFRSGDTMRIVISARVPNYNEQQIIDIIAEGVNGTQRPIADSYAWVNI